MYRKINIEYHCKMRERLCISVNAIATVGKLHTSCNCKILPTKTVIKSKSFIFQYFYIKGYQVLMQIIFNIRGLLKQWMERPSLLTSAKLWISFRTHLHSLKYLSSNNSSDGSNLFLNVDLEREYFCKLFLHLKFINFKLLMTPMLLFFNNASLKIMNAVIFCSFQPFWCKVKYKTTKFKAIYWCMNFDKDFVQKRISGQIRVIFLGKGTTFFRYLALCHFLWFTSFF